jgi:hypothetical protein
MQEDLSFWPRSGCGGGKESIVQPALFEMGDDVNGQLDSDVSTYNSI